MRESIEDVKKKVATYIKELGLSIEDVAADKYEILVAKKEELDTKTRRKVRAFWAPVGVLVGVVIGYVAATFF